MPGKRNTNKPARKTTSRKARSPEQSNEPRASARAEPRSADKNDRGDLQSLPDDLRSQVDRALSKRPKGLESIRKIYDHFKLKDHGITYKSFSAYVRREGWRSRLAATGRIVEAMFGASDRDEADRLCNSAYMSLMSIVARTLQEKVELFPSDELARLSKIITEQRAVGVRERNVELKAAKQTDTAGGSDKTKPPTTGLPDNFDEIVRRIYGVEIKDEKKSCQL